jgi:nucleoside 2-deoxyribosyltransferase
MPFDEKRNLLYESVIAPALDSHSLFAFDHSRADRLLTTGKITEEIAQHLREADVIIADISEPNPNVFYELGFAHAAETKAVLLKQQTDDKSVDVPFDLKIFRIHLYEFSTKGFADLRRKLQDILSNVLK